MNKKILIFCLLPILLISSCDEIYDKEDVVVPDKDYDGLLSEVDPDDNNNVYSFTQNVVYSQTQYVTKQDTVTIDYRLFVDTPVDAFSNDMAKMGGLLIADGSGGSGNTSINFLNNNYKNSESTINPTFVQIGLKNIKYYETKNIQQDSNDLIGLSCGQNTFSYNDSDYQVLVFNVFAYPVSGACWTSNCDVGANTNGYIETYGDSDLWTDKNCHKGFYVSAVRAYEFLKEYLNEVKDEKSETIVFLTGYSRGAGVANIMGKQLEDDKIKNFTYTYACPNTVASSNKDELTKYKNIHNIVNSHDLVTKVPLNVWDDFDIYGTKHIYTITGHEQEFKDYFSYDYVDIDDETSNEIIDIIKDITSTRNGLYEYQDWIDYCTYDTKEEAETVVGELKEGLDWTSKVSSLIDLRMELNEESLYLVKYRCKPALIVELFSEVMNLNSFSLSTILPVVEKYSPFVNQFVPRDLISFIGRITDLINGIYLNHISGTYIFGMDLIK